MKLVRIPDLSRYAYQVDRERWPYGYTWWTREALLGGGVQAVSDNMTRHLRNSGISVLDPDSEGPDALYVNGKQYRGRFRWTRTAWVLKDLGPHHGAARCEDLVRHYHCRERRRMRNENPRREV